MSQEAERERSFQRNLHLKFSQACIQASHESHTDRTVRFPTYLVSRNPPNNCDDDSDDAVQLTIPPSPMPLSEQEMSKNRDRVMVATASTSVT